MVKILKCLDITIFHLITILPYYPVLIVTYECHFFSIGIIPKLWPTKNIFLPKEMVKFAPNENIHL